MPTDLPFTKFSGQIKQIETDFRFPIMKCFFETCFSEFDDIDKQFAYLKHQGINAVVSAAGVQTNFGFRPRRFAGGPGLPKGRFSPCATVRTSMTEALYATRSQPTTVGRRVSRRLFSTQ
jgi:hypothetical protein